MNDIKNEPRVTIITPSFNSEKNIEETILSVLNQTYSNLEYIIIDGGSTDGTVDIIKKYQDRLAYWISEPDKGISGAFNKGLMKATGGYINFQGADDYLISNTVIESMMADVDPEKDILVCGRIERIKDTKEKEVVFTSSINFKNKRSLLFRMSLPHQALFTNKKFFEKYGHFDLNNKFCMDYEILLRAYKDFPPVILKDIIVSAWREGGVGKDKTLEIFKEYFLIKKKNEVAPVWILYMIHLWSILKYKVIKKLLSELFNIITMPEEKLTSKPHDNSVDILKGIAIIAVIFGHIASPIGSFLYSWHMPLFFFISGFFIKTNEPVKTFLIKNFKRILIYFFIFAIIGFLVTYFRNIFQGREHESILQGFAGIFYWMDMGHLNNYGFVLWFLPALFWGKFINFTLLKYLKNKVIIGVLIASIFSLIISTQMRLPFALDIGILASLWIYIGYIFYNYLREPVLKYWYYVLIVIAPFLVFLQVPSLNLSDRSFSLSIYNVIFSLFIIIPLYILVAKINPRLNSRNKMVKTLSYCGQNTMFLFVFHPYTNNIVYLIVNRFFNDIWYIKFILSFGLIYLTLIITRKYLNKTILKHV